MIEARIAENAKKQEAVQRRQREERQKMMQENVEQEKAKIAAYEDELRVCNSGLWSSWAWRTACPLCIVLNTVILMTCHVILDGHLPKSAFAKMDRANV